MRLPARRLGHAVSLLLLLAVSATAQVTTSTITGRTRDASGGVLAGVRVRPARGAGRGQVLN